MAVDALVVALSGPVGAGKTTLARALTVAHGAYRVSTRDVLVSKARSIGQRVDRGTLQLLGEYLDTQTNGKWVIEACEPALSKSAVVVIDSVRVAEQLAAIGEQHAMARVHLTAPLEVLESRYEKRRRNAPKMELESFHRVRAHPIEAAIETLAAGADIVLDTSIYDPDRILREVTRALCRRQQPRG